MIYLAELCSFFQFCCFLDQDVATVAQWFKVGGLTGHSQGVICAVVVAMANSQEHFVETALQFLTYMFYHGVRVQQVYPIKQLPAKGQTPAKRARRVLGGLSPGPTADCLFAPVVGV